MNKNKLFLLVSIISACAIAGATIIATNSVHNLGAAALTDESSDDYTLTLNHSNQMDINDNSVLTSLGNQVTFAADGNYNKTPSTGWFKFGEYSGSNAVYNTDPISGMKSLSLILDDETVYLHYGYKEDGVIHYSNYYALTGVDQGDGKYKFTPSFDEVHPSYFKLTPNNSNRTIDSLTIEYSCSESGFVPTEISAFSFTPTGDPVTSYQVDGLVFSRSKVQTLIVPGSYNEKPVTRIRNGAFWTNTAIEYVIISDGITYIGDQAFLLDASLKNVVFPSNYFEMGDEVFEGCAALETVEISESQTSINLAAYAGSQFLKNIDVAEGNPNYYSINGMLYEKSSDTLLICPGGKTGTVTIPNTCKRIGSLAFKNSRATSISIGSGVQLIEETFRTCNYLTSFSVDSSNTVYASESDMLCNKSKNTLLAYPKGNIEDMVTLPSSIRTINDYVFDKANNIQTLDLANTVTVGKEAFTNMANLRAIDLSSVTDIGEGACKNDTKLTSVHLNNSLGDLPDEIFMGCSTLASISLPSHLVTIGEKAFKDCSLLSNFAPVKTFPNTMTTIGKEAFMNCTSLDVDAISEFVTSIGKAAFRNTATDSFIFSTSMNYIPDEMFWDCDNLTAITILPCVKTIGYDAFRSCGNLEDVTIVDNSVETIRSRAFYGCNISNIFIPKCVTLIEGSAFAGGASTIDIDTDVVSPEGQEYSSSLIGGGGWLRPGWDAAFGSGYTTYRIHYSQSR